MEQHMSSGTAFTLYPETNAPAHSPQPFLQYLAEGFEGFVHENYRSISPQSPRTRFQDLVENGQHPLAFVIHCADARSSAPLVLGTRPGELFTNATIGAIVPPESRVVRCARHIHPALGSLAARFNPLAHAPHTWAALQYAVHGLQVPHVVVLGHTGCGGLKALVDGNATGYIAHWISSARPLLKLANDLYAPGNTDALRESVEKANVVWGVANTVRHLDQTNPACRPDVHGLLFDMKAGLLFRLTNPQTGSFEPISTIQNATALPHVATCKLA